MLIFQSIPALNGLKDCKNKVLETRNQVKIPNFNFHPTDENPLLNWAIFFQFSFMLNNPNA